MLFFLVHRGEEDDRDALGLLALADDAGGLVAVHARHVDVEQDHRELALEQMAQRLLAGAGDHDLGQILDHGADGEQVVLVVVDDQDRAARSARRRLGSGRGRRRQLRRCARRRARVHRFTRPPSRSAGGIGAAPRLARLARSRP